MRAWRRSWRPFATRQDRALYARIAAVAENSAVLDRLDAEQRRLVEVTLQRFQREGAMLGAAEQARLKQINTELAGLYTRFSQNQLADEENDALLMSDPAELAGLPPDLCAAAAAAAEQAGQPGQWRFANTRSTIEPLLRGAASRSLRERAWRLFGSRGDHAGERDNKPLIGQMLKLRRERAELLGHPHHAAWVTANNMAGTSEAALALLTRLWQAASSKAREEIAALQALAEREHGASNGAGTAPPIAPWDYRYYAEKLSALKFNFDEHALKPYLQLDRLRDAMFWVAGELYGITFTPLAEAPVYHPQVTAYRVERAGEPVGVFYFDPYARKGKQSGAWMSNLRDQQRLDADAPVLPIVTNNANFTAAATPGEPVLISWGDATTLFHEFGHGLHGLLSAVSYPTLSGTAVKNDFVEFPSQLTERWLRTPEVLGRFARHVETGEPLPAALLDALDRSRHFMQGMASCEYLLSALYDLRIHSLTGRPDVDPAAFEHELMQALDCPAAVTMRHRPAHFSHIFAGDSYSAGYYVYLWADALVADAVEAFEAAGSFYDRTLVDKLHQHIMSAGNSIPSDEAFRRMRGRDVNADALLRSRGFAAA
jgi:peptidyl-dipeptidase Dcp